MLSGKSYLAIQAASFAARSSTDRPPSAAKYFAALQLPLIVWMSRQIRTEIMTKRLGNIIKISDVK